MLHHRPTLVRKLYRQYLLEDDRILYECMMSADMGVRSHSAATLEAREFLALCALPH